jgi:glyoxylase-like metal-dependent hydrolase (beta-lactamase superfamily II)
METINDGSLEIVVAGPAGFGNNIYIVIDRETNEAALVDAPGEPEKWLDAIEQAGVRPSKILLTHSHGDHTASIDIVKEKYGATLYADAREPWLKDGQLDVAVSPGDEVKVGNLGFSVISNPGHTPGSTTFVHGPHAFVGDTLFPGGPGATRTNENLLQEIESIKAQLYTLPDETVIYPGHGGRTTIGASKAEYALFAARDHDPDLHGDVLWLES